MSRSSPAVTDDALVLTDAWLGAVVVVVVVLPDGPTVVVVVLPDGPTVVVVVVGAMVVGVVVVVGAMVVGVVVVVGAMVVEVVVVVGATVVGVDVVVVGSTVVVVEVVVVGSTVVGVDVVVVGSMLVVVDVVVGSTVVVVEVVVGSTVVEVDVDETEVMIGLKSTGWMILRSPGSLGRPIGGLSSSAEFKMAMNVAPPHAAMFAGVVAIAGRVNVSSTIVAFPVAALYPAPPGLFVAKLRSNGPRGQSLGEQLLPSSSQFALSSVVMLPASVSAPLSGSTWPLNVAFAFAETHRVPSGVPGTSNRLKCTSPCGTAMLPALSIVPLKVPAGDGTVSSEVISWPSWKVSVTLPAGPISAPAAWSPTPQVSSAAAIAARRESRRRGLRP
jgi:hypothetical protein